MQLKPHHSIALLVHSSSSSAAAMETTVKHPAFALSETDSGPTIRNRFQKTAELARIDSDKNYIFPITSAETLRRCQKKRTRTIKKHINCNPLNTHTHTHTHTHTGWHCFIKTTTFYRGNWETPLRVMQGVSFIFIV